MDYRASGVDIDLGKAFVKGISHRLARSKSQGILEGIGGFAGLFELPAGMNAPVLVAGTDGVGTKLKIAQACQQHDTIGIDLVAMCVNDVLTTGAKPLFFLDYLATGKLDPAAMLQVIDGIATGCEQAGCALLGGETAEMPGFYPAGEYDLAGFCVGVVEKSRILSGSAVQLGDRLLALPSSGVHSNGYSLVRRIVADRGWEWSQVPPGWDQSLGEVFLRPTLIYVSQILAALSAGLGIRAMAHITGGGLPENLPRSLATGQSARIRPQSWLIPREFEWIRQQGQVEWMEMFRTFNMGVGLIVIVPPDQMQWAMTFLPQAIDIGEVEAGKGEVLGLEQWIEN